MSMSLASGSLVRPPIMLDMTPVAEVKEWRLKSLVTYVVKPKPIPCSSALMNAMIQILVVNVSG
jgi:hypothetical protein